MTHAVVAVSAGCVFGNAGVPKRLWLLAIIAAVLPDADVIGYQYLYIPYGHVPVSYTHLTLPTIQL